MLPQAAEVLSNGGERCRNAGTMILADTVERGERKRGTAELSKVDLTMSEPEGDP